uniref:Uncharacterized protein n=1 Tax=Nelumbo nucifera TaxID=4432 RepID=A0A822ZJT8_NELNU|nr:TPA_asm: hypothetical protein HUJ06_001859 [Nelumbo nucifera]
MVKSSSPVRMQHNPDEPEKEESYHAKRAPSENEKMDLHCSDLHSPHRNPERSSSPVRQMFTSPERSPYVQQSPGQKPISPPQVFT